MIRKQMMPEISTWWRKVLTFSCGLVFASAGGCLPENFFAEKAGEIVNGLIVSGINMALADSGLQI
ncbi:MAG: hypothetical protein ACE5HE_05420 [Phycisphaerae bacterium]